VGADVGASRSGGRAKSFDWGSLATARTLAWAGGLIFLLGVFFFLALAIQRGWLSEAGRCTLGALASLGLVGAAVELRRRVGALQTVQLLAGVGIAGLYGSLLAATGLYELLSLQLALAGSLATSALAVGVALAFRAQAIACLGFGAAMLAGPMLGVDLDTAGVLTLLVVNIAAGAVAVGRRWAYLLAGAPVLTWLQVLAWYETAGPAVPSGALTVAFGAVVLLAALGWELRHGYRSNPHWVTAGVLGATGPYWLAAIFLRADGDLLGIPASAWWTAGVGAVYALTPAALALWRRPPRNLVTWCWAGGLLALFIAFAVAWGDEPQALGAVLAMQAAALAYLSRRVGEPRLTCAAAGHLAVALGVVLVLAPPSELFDPLADLGWTPALSALIALAAATGLLSAYPWARRYSPWLTAAACVYAGSLAIIAAFAGDVVNDPATPATAIVASDFQLAQALLSAFWGLVGLLALYVGLRLRGRGREVRMSGFGLLVLAVAKLFLYDLDSLKAEARTGSFLVLGALLLIAGFHYQKLSAERADDDPAPVGAASHD